MGATKTVKARFVATGYQGPDLRDGNVDIAGCVSRRSPHLQLISLGALKERAIWSLDIKDDFLKADGFGREVHVHAQREWISKDDRRVWRLRAPVYGLNGAPVEFRRRLRKFRASSAESLSCGGLRFEASSPDPRLGHAY